MLDFVRREGRGDCYLPMKTTVLRTLVPVNLHWLYLYSEVPSHAKALGPLLGDQSRKRSSMLISQFTHLLLYSELSKPCKKTGLPSGGVAKQQKSSLSKSRILKGTSV
jgi:hypothetical protein